MALLASQASVTPRQREVGFIMIEGNSIPVGGLMTGSAVSSEFAVVFIVLFVAGITISRSAFVSAVLMTLLTACFLMFAFQFEDREIVIELCRFPGISGMTSRAIRTKPTFVRLVSAMAEVAVLRKRLQVRDGARVQMTLRADHVRVFACQLKCEFVVIEIFTIAIHAIVAGETLGAEGEQMGLGEGKVQLAVAGLAGVWSERGNVAVMAIVANEWFIPSRELMSIQ